MNPSPSVFFGTSMSEAFLPPSPEDARKQPGHTYRPGEALQELPPEWAGPMHELGITILQADSLHLNTSVSAEGQWDWDWWDPLVVKCRQMGFKPAAFPHWHWPPPWYVQEVGLESCRCLAHDKPLACFSVWDPAVLPWFDRCIRAFADHCRIADTTPDCIYLGIHGDFGECMFPCVDTEFVSARTQVERGETVDHCHMGLWCGDRHAREHFRRQVLNKYSDMAGVNRAWASELAREDQLDFPRRGACSRRAWLDFAHWYLDGMTAFTGNVAKLYRRHFPEAILVVPLGGAVEPLEFGQDNTALPKAMRETGTHVRSTAGGCCAFNDAYQGAEKFTRVYPILKRISTACRFYGVPMWTEAPYPPGMNDVAITARVFETVSCGAIGYFDWNQTFHRQHKRYHQLLGAIKGKTPIVDTAVLFPTSSHLLAQSHHAREDYWQNMPERFWEGCSRLRAICDYDVVDERLIQDGALAGYQFLVIIEADVMEARTADRIRQWVRGGGRLVLAAGETETVEGEPLDFMAAPEGGAVHVFAPGSDDLTGLPALCEQVRREAAPEAAEIEVRGGKGRADSVFQTRFADGWAVLNLNAEPVKIRLAGKELSVAGYDIALMDLP